MRQNEEIQQIADEVFDASRLSSKFSYEECLTIAKNILLIRILKKEKDIAIFAHTYVNSEILEFVADVRGDSLFLAEQAKKVPQKNFLFAAVRFMAESAKILNPQKKVFLAAREGGCSLAESITAPQVKSLRMDHPEATFVCYVNTTADIKALCDVCATSTNALKVLSHIPNNHIFFLPDRWMGENLSKALKEICPEKKLSYWSGSCVVHERFSAEEIDYWRLREKDLVVMAHPECKPEVTAKADFIGSTSQIGQALLNSPKSTFLLLTECGLASNLQWKQLAEKKIVGSCSLCPYMKSNSLNSLIEVMTNLYSKHEIHVPEPVRREAFSSFEQMWNLS